MGGRGQTSAGKRRQGANRVTPESVSAIQKYADSLDTTDRYYNQTTVNINGNDDYGYGKTFMSLPAFDRNMIESTVSISVSNWKDIVKYGDSKGFDSTKTVRIGDKTYKTHITKKGDKILYGLTSGRKVLVKDGTMANVVNELAKIAKKEL